MKTARRSMPSTVNDTTIPLHEVQVHLLPFTELGICSGEQKHMTIKQHEGKENGILVHLCACVCQCSDNFPTCFFEFPCPLVYILPRCNRRQPGVAFTRLLFDGHYPMVKLRNSAEKIVVT